MSIVSNLFVLSNQLVNCKFTTNFVSVFCIVIIANQDSGGREVCFTLVLSFTFAFFIEHVVVKLCSMYANLGGAKKIENDVNVVKIWN